MIVIIYIVMLLSAFMFVKTVSIGNEGNYKIQEWVEPAILTHRILTSPLCFAYVDNVNRAHMGVIDLQRYNQENFNRCFNSKHNNYAFSITLDIDKIEFSDKYNLKSINWNKLGVPDNSYGIKVIIRDEGRQLNGILIVDVMKISNDDTYAPDDDILIEDESGGDESEDI